MIVSEQEYSPLPWWLDRGAAIFDVNGEGVYIDTRDAKEIANANLIVTAVNAHAELLAAAKEAVTILDNIRVRRVWDGNEITCLVRLSSAIARAEAAL